MYKTAIAGLAAALISTAAFAGSDVKQLIQEAKATNQKADSVGYMWRDAGKMIKAAEKALAKGKKDKAMELAEEAKKQGILAYQQYLDQRNAGPSY